MINGTWVYKVQYISIIIVDKQKLRNLIEDDEDEIMVHAQN